MGQKVNPISNRLGFVRGWDSNWFGGKNFGDSLLEDNQIRKYLTTRLGDASISRIVIERTLKLVTITVCTARPGLIIGKGGQKVDEWGSECMGDSYSYVGAVVGATYPEMGKVLRKVMPKAYILVPGYGAQGGKASDLAPYFNEDGLGAIVNSSRGIIAAYTKEPYASKFGALNFGDAARQATIDMIEDLKTIR